eukprot:354263-Chlamydomonas_euryale.AAC.1
MRPAALRVGVSGLGLAALVALLKQAKDVVGGAYVDVLKAGDLGCVWGWAGERTRAGVPGANGLRLLPCAGQGLLIEGRGGGWRWRCGKGGSGIDANKRVRTAPACHANIRATFTPLRTPHLPACPTPDSPAAPMGRSNPRVHPCTFHTQHSPACPAPGSLAAPTGPSASPSVPHPHPPHSTLYTRLHAQLRVFTQLQRARVLHKQVIDDFIVHFTVRARDREVFIGEEAVAFLEDGLQA